MIHRKRSVQELWRIALQIAGRPKRKTSGELKRSHQNAMARSIEPALMVNRMFDCVKGTGDLSQEELRQELKKKNLEEWRDMLDNFKDKLSNATELPRFDQDKPGYNLVCDMFFSCVEEDLYEHLRATITWLVKLQNDTIHDFAMQGFRQNNKAMLRACRKNDLDMVSALFSKEFTIKTQLLEKWNVIDLDESDIMLQLTLLEAMARPVYLIAQYNNNKTDDPVYQALRIINKCSEIAGRRLSLINKIEEISDLLKNFVIRMLDLCESSEEIRVFLNKDDNLGSISLKGTMRLPRINQAMQLNFKEFVNHDYCQQMARANFYQMTSFKNRKDGSLVLMWHIFVQVLKTPFVCLGHSLAKVKGIINPRGQNVTVNQAVEQVPLKSQESRDDIMTGKDCFSITVSKEYRMAESSNA